jgi:CdiI immunity protein
MKDYSKLFPELSRLMGYFLLGWETLYNWQEENSHYKELVRHFKTESSPKEIAQSIDELEQFIQIDLDENELHDILVHEFRANIYPPGMEMTYRHWLGEVSKILKDEDTENLELQFTIQGTPPEELGMYLLWPYLEHGWENEYDWQGEQPNIEQVVSHFKAINPTEWSSKAASDIEELLTESLSESELENMINEDFEIDYDPHRIGVTYRQWLGSIHKILATPFAECEKLMERGK